MDEFSRELRMRIDEATATIEEARAEGDEFLAEMKTGELESLGHLARAHGVAVELPDAVELPELPDGPGSGEIDLTALAEEQSGVTLS